MKNIHLESNGKGIDNKKIIEVLKKVSKEFAPIKKALILPPDISRMHSYAKPIIKVIIELLKGADIDIMPALGTHGAMTDNELDLMYGGVPHEMFIVHRWRDDTIKIGEVPASFVNNVSEGYINKPIDVDVNKRLFDKSYNIIISVGQIVPHEVSGIANYNKNIFIGCGGKGMIGLSHYLAALYGIKRIIGKTDTPVRKILNYAEKNFLSHIPLLYILTVTTLQSNGLRLESLSIGNGTEIFEQAAKVSIKKNFTLLNEPLQKVVVYLDPLEFKTSWLCNKSIYRTCMAMADGGELIVIAPGLHSCSDDKENDILIKKYGYKNKDDIIKLVAENEDLKHNLVVAAHLIHGTSNGKFRITYAPGAMTKEEIKSLNYNYMPLNEALSQYDVNNLKDGFNKVNGEKIFFISNPAMGLWAYKKCFFGEGRE